MAGRGMEDWNREKNEGLENWINGMIEGNQGSITKLIIAISLYYFPQLLR